MVAPHPDLQRRFINTDNIVKVRKHYLVPNLHTKYPQDYLDLITHDSISKIKPWIEKDRLFKSFSLQPFSSVVTGSDKILVLCVDFSDRPASITIDTIRNRYFGSTGNTLKNYYNENSYGTYIPDGLVYPITVWYRAPQPLSYYRDDPSTASSDYGMGNYPHNTQRLFEDVLDLVNNDPNITTEILNSIDLDNDNNINRVLIVHSGGEAAWGGNINDIWAHAWGIYPKTIKGKTFSDYAMSAEYILSPLDIQRTGIDCHEYAHILGLPDLYDDSLNSNGVGYFSLMGSGSWADIANTPVHLDAWSKYYLGWSNTIENPVGIVNIETAQLNSINYKYTTTDPLEYFMVENRQTILFDSYLPAYGLLIWHINEHQQYNNNELCFKVGLVQADGLRELENKINIGDGGDSYPGSTNNRSFGSSTIPSSSLCNNTVKDMLINNIFDIGGTISFNSYLPTSPLGSIEFRVYPLTSSDIYFDTTYKGTTDPITGILIINNIPIGMINYTVKKTGYYDKSGSVEIIANTTVTVYVILNVIPATVNMTSVPSEAKIYMDDIDTLQVTPATITNLSVGSHTYKLTLTGYYDKTGSFLISAGQMLNINVNLNLITKGELNIVSNPIGAEVYIDNIDTFQVTPVTISNLDVGNHIYKLTLTGYYDKIDTFGITAGQTTIVDVGNLTSLPPTTGTLYITSSPVGAEIYINDIDKQVTTPAIILDLLPGTYTYKLVLAGYKNKIGTFDITAGQETIIDVGDLEMIVAEAGMGAAGMILVVGMLAGSIFMKKSPIERYQ